MSVILNSQKLRPNEKKHLMDYFTDPMDLLSQKGHFMSQQLATKKLWFGNNFIRQATTTRDSMTYVKAYKFFHDSPQML